MNTESNDQAPDSPVTPEPKINRKLLQVKKTTNRQKKDATAPKKSFGVAIHSSCFRCYYCEAELNGQNRTKDHMVPKSKGGILSKDNKVYSCFNCNQLKGDLDPVEFLFLIDNMTRHLGKIRQNIMYAMDKKTEVKPFKYNHKKRIEKNYNKENFKKTIDNPTPEYEQKIQTGVPSVPRTNKGIDREYFRE